MKKGLGVLLIVALMMSMLVGCGPKAPAETTAAGGADSGTTAAPADTTAADGKEVKGNVLKFNLGAEPETIDPSLNGAIDGSHMINNTFEALMREIDGELTPAMAESVDVSEDGTVYTFHLRDAKWSDGKPVRAQDFEYGWKRVLNPETAAPYSTHMYYIKNAQAYFEGKASIDEVGIECPDEKTFKVTLETPTPYFQSLITRPAFMPLRQDVIEKNPDQWAFTPGQAISNGPFVLDSFATGDKIVLKKNPEYWNADSVKLDAIECRMIVEASTALTAFETGDLDIIGNIPQQEIARIMTEDPQCHILPMLGTYYLEFNVNVKPLDDVRVRRALSLAVDRRSITENVKRGGEIPATGFNPVGLKDSQGRDFNQTAGSYGIDVDNGNLEEAKKLLADAGYPDGKGFPVLKLLYNTSESHKAVCEAVQEMWKTGLGIEIELGNQEWAVFQNTRTEGNFEICRGGYIGDYPDPVGLLELLVEGSKNNHPHWVDKEYNDLIKKSRFAKGKERDDLVYRAEEILMDQAPIAPLFYYTDPVLVKDYVKGWQKNSMSYWYFGKVEIE